MEPHIGLTVGLMLLVCVTWMTGYIWRDASVASCFFSLVTVISSVAGLVASSH